MPISPGAAGASFDVLLAFSLDPEANRRVQTGISTMEEELKRIQGEAGKVGDEYKKSSEEVKKSSKETTKELTAQARVMKREAAAITDDLKKAQVGALKEISGFIGQISQTALIAGAAITGGIFAEVSNYVNNAKQATAVTRAWKRETASLAQSRTRVDEVLAREALPLLQQAAKVANQAAGFVEKHPEIVQAALKTGVALASLGAIGTAVSKGIKLTADINSLKLIGENLVAAKLQDTAADKQLAAAQMRAGQPVNIPGQGPAKGAPSLLSGIPLLAITAGAAAYSAIGRGAANFGAKQFGTTPEKFWQDLIGKVGESIPFVKKFGDAIFGTGDAAKKAAGDLSQVSNQLAGSENEKAVVDAFTSWKEDDARIVKEAADNRKQIIEEGEKAIADATKKYTDQRVSINAQADSRAADITSRFNEENQRALDQYNKAREDALKNESEQLAQIAQDRQDRLAEIEKEGADRLEELGAARDALGLAKEQERINDEKKAVNQDAKRAADRVKQETAARLIELANQYAQEQAQRAQQYQQDLAQNEAQRQAELAQAAADYQAEIQQQRAAQAAKLAELQAGLNAERARRREVFIQQIRDLDDSLLGERNLRLQKYQEMLSDAEAWLAQYRSTLAGGLPTAGVTVTGHSASGGYVGYGTRQLGELGYEFVMTHAATKAAENLIGGTLTQENLLRALGAGSNTNVTYNDNRRLNGPTSKDEKMLSQRTAEEALLRAIGR